MRVSGKDRVSTRLSPAAGTGNPATAADCLQAVERLTHLNETARLFAAFDTVDQTFQGAIAVAAEVLPLTSAILIQDEGAGRTITLWAAGGNGGPTPAAREHAEAMFTYLVGAPEFGPSGAGAPGGRRESPALPGPVGAVQFIVLPLVVADRPVCDVLQVEGHGFDKLDLMFVSTLASQFAVALDRDRAWRRDIVRRDHAEVMEVTLEAQAAALIAADDQRSEMLAALAAELRSSLAVFREIQRLMIASRGDDRIDRAVTTMHGQIQQTARLIDDLQSLSRLTQAATHVTRARVEFSAILASATQRGRERLQAQGRSLTVAGISGPALLEGDPVQLEQVLDVLIDKAAELASPGGRIWLTARIVAGGSREHQLPGGFDGPQVIVTLRDDGAGNVPSILPRVFDLLRAEGQSVNPADTRFGSGLLLVRRIVELHGGAIRAVSSGLGQGSEFELRLPISGRQSEVLHPERRSS